MRHGADVFISPGKGGHSSQRVLLEQLLTICRWYPSLPDVRSLSGSEIRLFYDGLRAELKQHTKPSSR